MPTLTLSQPSGELRIHMIEAGPADGALVVLLHGFPEASFAWRALMGALAEAGFRVVALDQRGYGLSDKPRGVDAYRLDRLADDVAGLIAALGAERAQIVGHDWGGAVGWWLATRRPERILRMAILNAPHPAIWRDAMANDPEQRRRSRYVQLLRVPWLPELLIRAGRYKGLEQAVSNGARPPDAASLIRYREAWTQPGALTAMINWYRALFRQDLPIPSAGAIDIPTLLIWGDRDPFGTRALATRSAALGRDVTVEHWPDGTHWTLHDEPERLALRLKDFLDRDH